MTTWGSPIFISVKATRSPSDRHDKRRFSSHRGRRGIARSSSHGHDDLRSPSHLGDMWKRAGRSDRHRTVQTSRGRTPGSWRDRAAIAHHSLRNQSTIIRRHFLENLEHDRCPIVARSWRDCGRSWRKSWPPLRLICSKIVANS